MNLRAVSLFAIPAVMVAPLLHAAESKDHDPIQVYVMDRYTYDDNLFRVPDGLLASDPTLVAPQSLDDYVNRASAGVRLQLDASQQVFHADVRIDDVRYQRNDYLDYTGGDAELRWDWQLAGDWSGKLFGTYERQQASLNNYRLFQQDIVDAAAYGAEVRFELGSRWRLLAAGAAAKTDHSAELRRTENFESTSGRGGLEYATPSGSVFALEYRLTNADFPVTEALTGASHGYDEQVPGVRIEYVYSEKTQVLLNAGYLMREYDDPALADYSGAIWDVTMKWEPRVKIDFDIKAWHQLKAYVDAESDYFVADGVSITPQWKPTTMIKVAAAFSYEKQDYTGTGNGVIVIPEEADREDEVTAAQLSLEYTPRDLISIGLAYRWTDRSSNRDFRGYDDNVASVQVKLTF